MPYIVEGEIIQLVEKLDERDPLRYVCKVTLENGSEVILPSVQAATMFGGIGDYFQIRSRTAVDGLDEFQNQPIDAKLNASTGDRVYISFINGSLLKPVIIGYAPHPNQTNEFAGNVDPEKPAAILQYQGIRIEVNSDGELRFIRKGAPEIEFKPKGEAGAAGAAIGALLGALGGDQPGLSDSNDAIKNQDSEEITLFEFLKGGVFRLRDSDGQMIEVDRTKKRIYISNNDLKSTEDSAVGPASGGNQISTNSTDAEYVLLDKKKEMVLINARKIAQIYSFDRRKDVTEGNHRHKVGGDNEWLVGGDETYTIDGSRAHTVEGTDALDVTGDRSVGVGGDWTLVSNGQAILEGSGATLKLSKGKVGLGGPGAELLDLIDQELDKLKDLFTEMSNPANADIGNLGYPVVYSPGYSNAMIAVLLGIATIKTALGTIKGGI